MQHSQVRKPSSRNRSGRGRGCPSLGLSSFQNEQLQEVSDILFRATSESTKRNVRMATKLLEVYASKHGAADPEVVTFESSKLVVNLLSEYCRIDSDSPLTIPSMRGLVQGLAHLYKSRGHITAWNISADGVENGNPLIGNIAIDELQKTLRIRLSQVGCAPMKARPITASQICHHAELYWYGGRVSMLDCRDVMLHAILVLGINMGMRYDEISKLTVGHVSIDCGEISLNIRQAIKNSTAQRSYSLHKWPKTSELQHSVYMDPQIAILTWLMTRGHAPGPLFCNVQITNHVAVLHTSRPWSVSNFTIFLRQRLKSLGVGEDDVGMYSGHSLKRGAVQLYRSLGYKDEYIMEIVQMTGPNSYFQYCAAYNTCAPLELPRFNGRMDLISHANALAHESDGLDAEESFEDFLARYG